ncbi:MAG TPA: type II toxin-antitoxin system mRNA interferase toxin, RelE/StbE family [Dehalococcoidia bacterium]|nr:type II toxin-antitoxin system mRNA interferase toxin, RelE/StbE family [Dehalococcoidia bacterium]
MYSVRILRRAIKDIADLLKGYARLVGEHIERLREKPRSPGAKKLRGTTDYSLRVGVYRILYDIDDSAGIVTVYRVKHRHEAYR